MDIMGTDVEWVLVDTGSSFNMLYLDMFQKLKLNLDNFHPVKTQLLGFNGDTIKAKAMVEIEVLVLASWKQICGRGGGGEWTC